MSLLHITRDNFEAEVLKSEKPVLVDFFATWCGPCRMVAPVLEEIAEENENIKVVKIDVDQEPGLAARDWAPWELMGAKLPWRGLQKEAEPDEGSTRALEGAVRYGAS